VGKAHKLLFFVGFSQYGDLIAASANKGYEGFTLKEEQTSA
jgi:hypothetical protein